MPAMLDPRCENMKDTYRENIKPFLLEAVDFLALTIKSLNRHGRWHFIDMIYRDTNRRSAFSLKLAHSILQEIEKISPPDAAFMAAQILQLSPDIGIGRISVGQLLYATALYNDCTNVSVIDISNTSYNDNSNYSPLGFQVGEYLASNSIASWACAFTLDEEHDATRCALPNSRENETTITQLFHYNCIELKNVFSGISSAFHSIHKQIKIISAQI